MRISGTKTLCVLLALFALTSGAAALAFMDNQWAVWLLALIMLTAICIGFPAAVMGMFRKLDDDRGRKGIYTYLDEDASQSNDRWHMVYPLSVGSLVVAFLMVVLGSVEAFVFHGASQSALAGSDPSHPWGRAEAAEMTGFCVRLCIVASMGIAYLLRGKGRFLVGLSLTCGGAFMILGLILYLAASA
jgi:hypothetical protein